MNLLAGKLYDPAVAVNKVTTALLAMTALDTTNLRLVFSVPASGMVKVRLAGVLHGATTYPQIVLGVMNGAAVAGRMAPMTGGGNLAATSMQMCEAVFLVTGLTPGASLSYDAAYGVETLVAATGLKYGGPNNTTTNDAFGGFAFEIYDPCPVYTPSSGVPPTTAVSSRIDTIQTTDTAIKTKTDFLPSATAGASGGVFIAGTNAATSITTALTANITGNVSGSVGSVTGAVGSVTGAVGSVTGAVGSVTGNVSGSVASVVGAVGSVTGLTASNLDATISSRMASYTQPTGFLAATFPSTIASTTNITAGTITTVTNLTNAPTAGDFTATMKTSIGTAVAASAVASVTGNVGGSVASVVGLTVANLDAAVSTRLAASGYTAPDNAGVSAIKAKTDLITFTVAGQVDANIKSINETAVIGNGQSGTEWGP